MLFFFWQLNMQTVFCEFDLSRPCGVKTTTEMGNIKIVWWRKGTVLHLLSFVWRCSKIINKECTAFASRADRPGHRPIYESSEFSLKLNVLFIQQRLHCLCTVVLVGLPTLEEFEENLHLVGVLLEAAEQDIVSHHRFQQVWCRFVLEEALFAEGRGQRSFVQQLHHDIRKRKHIKKKGQNLKLDLCWTWDN